MSTPYQIIPLLEGLVGSLALTDVSGHTSLGPTQPVAEWVKSMKNVMLAPGNRDKDDWAFIGLANVIQTAQDVETGARLYGAMVGSGSATGEQMVLCINDDADGTYTFDGTAAWDNLTQVCFTIPDAATTTVEDYWPFTFQRGLPFTNHMVVAADGQDGTNPVANQMRCWLLYRTVVGE